MIRILKSFCLALAFLIVPACKQRETMVTGTEVKSTSDAENANIPNADLMKSNLQIILN